MKIYGIKNCDTVKKAQKALEGAGLSPELVDVRETPLKAADLQGFFEEFGDALVNRRSTTWRILSEDERAGDPIELLLAHPTLMKRPVIEQDEKRTLGWDKVAQAAWL